MKIGKVISILFGLWIWPHLTTERLIGSTSLDRGENTSHTSVISVQRTLIIPEKSTSSQVQYDRQLNKWSVKGLSDYGLIELEAVLDIEENALIYIGSINENSFVLETRYISVEDKVVIHGFSKETGYIYLDIVFINELQIASLSGSVGGKSIDLELEDIGTELHWAYVTSNMLASLFGIN